MGYRWFNVDVEHKEDGSVEVHFEGRSEFPFGERVEVEEGEKLRVHGLIEMENQPENVEWSMKKS